MSDTSIDLVEATECLRDEPLRSLAICQRYLAIHPDDPSGLFSRNQAWKRLAEFQKALADMDRVLVLNPSSGGYSSRGQLFRTMGDCERAVADFTQARELDDSESETSHDPLFRADSLAQLGHLEDALSDCAFIPEDHWMPEHSGLPGGGKAEFVEEIRRRALAARKRRSSRSG
jgi:tetratricopeptide (TPR) repeat protein